MKKYLLPAIVFTLLCAAQIVSTANAAPFFPAQGGTGTSTLPAPGQVLIGNASNTYNPAYLQCSGGCQVATSSGAITITALGTSTISINANSGNVFQIVGTSGDVSSSVSGTTTTLDLANVINAGSCTSCNITFDSKGRITVAANGSSAGATTTINGAPGPAFNFTGVFSGSSFTIGSSTSGGSSTITYTIPNNLSAYNNDAGFLTLAITKINGATSTAQTIAGGSGISISTAASSTNSTTTVTLNVNGGSLQMCTAGQHVNSLSATGIITCQIAVQTIAGVNTSTITLIGAGGTSIATTTNSITLTSVSTSTPNTWTALQTFGSGAVINGTTTLGSTTNAMLLTDGSGNVKGYAGSNCSAGNAPTGISATGTVQNCTAYLTGNQSVTLTISGDATGTASGATSIADSITVQGLLGKALPSLATGTLQYSGGAWKLNNATSALGLFDLNGNLSSYGGTSCSAGTAIQIFSASGTASCVSVTASGSATTTISYGSTTFSGPNFTFASGTAIGITTSSPNTFQWNFLNPGYVTSASSVTWTAAISFQGATTTIASNTILSIIGSCNSSSSALGTNASGTIFCESGLSPSTTIPTNNNQLANGSNFITFASSGTWTAAITHNATTTFAANIQLASTTNCNSSNQALQSNASGTVNCGTLSFSSPATTTINGTQSASFQIVGDNVNITSTVSGSTTTFKLLNNGIGSGTYNWANVTVASTGIVTNISSNSAPLASINGDTTAAQKITSTGPITTTTSAGVTTIGFANPGYPTSASSVTWTAAQTFAATTTLASTTNIGGALNVSSTAAFQATTTFNGNVVLTNLTSTILSVDSNGKIVATTTAASGIASINSGTGPAYYLSCTSGCSVSTTTTSTAITVTASGSGNVIATGTTPFVPYFTGATTQQTTTVAFSSSTGDVTLSPNGTTTDSGLLTVYNASNTAALTVSTSTSPTSTILVLGPADVSGGNPSGTIIGSNEPTSSGADFLNFQEGSSSVFKVSSSGVVTFPVKNASGSFAYQMFNDGNYLDISVTGTQPGTSPVPYNIVRELCPPAPTTSTAVTSSSFECDWTQSESLPDGSTDFVDWNMQYYPTGTNPNQDFGIFDNSRGTSSVLLPFELSYNNGSANAIPFEVFTTGPTSTSKFNTQFNQGTNGQFWVGTSGTSTGSFVVNQNGASTCAGIYDSGATAIYGLTDSLPSPSGCIGLGGYFDGLGVGGVGSTSRAIFGALAAGQSSEGAGHTAFTVYGNNEVDTFNNVLDSGGSVGNATIKGNVAIGGTLNVTSTAIFESAVQASTTVNVSGTLNVVGVSTLASTTVAGNATATTLTVTGASTLQATTTHLASLIVSSTPTQAATTSLLYLGYGYSNIKNGSASGTFIGMNTSGTYNGFYEDYENNSTTVFSVASSGALVAAGSLRFGFYEPAAGLNCLGVLSSGNVATTTCGGVVTTSSAITSDNFPFWNGTGGGLNGTSSLSIVTSTGNIADANNLNIGGTLDVTSTATFESSVNASTTINASSNVTTAGFLTLSGPFFTQRALNNVANTTTASLSLVGTSTITGTDTIPASFLNQGDTIHFHLGGNFTANTGNYTYKVWLNKATTTCASAAFAPTAHTTGFRWTLDGYLTVQTTGATGVFASDCTLSLNSAATTNQIVDMGDATGTINTTIANTLGIVLTMATASTTNSVTTTLAEFDIER